jgi:hypothetical protein
VLRVHEVRPRVHVGGLPDPTTRPLAIKAYVTVCLQVSKEMYFLHCNVHNVVCRYVYRETSPICVSLNCLEERSNVVMRRRRFFPDTM